MNLSYPPGPHFLVAVPGLTFWATDEHLARRVWSAVDAGEAAQDLLVELVRDGLAGLGAFVLVDARDDRVRVLVRGEVTASVRSAQNGVRWSGSGVTTWAERVFDRVDDVLIGDEEPSAVWLPMRAGIVRCGGFELSGLVVDGDDPPSVGRHLAERSAPAVTPPPSAQLGRALGFAQPEPVAASLAIIAAPPHEEATPLVPRLSDSPRSPVPASAAPVPVTPAKSAAAQVSVADPDPEPSPNPPPVIPQADPAQTRTESPDDGFDHLFESTIMRSVEDAAIRNVSEEASIGSPRLGGDWPGAAGAGAAGFGSEAGIPAGVVEPTVLDARLGDHDGHTITAAQLGALRGELPSPDPAAPPPGAWLELSTGDVVALDRDVVIGRRPEVDRVQGGQVPTVVTVPSPRQDVSRTHLRIGWSGVKVLATDLHSMNGTVLIGPGGTSRTLDGGVPQQLAEGDMLDIGDGITLTLRLTPGSAAL